MRFNHILHVCMLIVLPAILFTDEPITESGRQLDAPEEHGLSFIDEEKLFAHLYFISSDLFEGRGATERGAELMSEYAAALFRLWGLRPVGDIMTFGGRTETSYFQNFHVIEYKALPSTSLQVVHREGDHRRERTYGLDREFKLGYEVNDNITITAPVVFAGYGLSVPQQFDELRNLDLKGKIVMIMSGLPKAGDTTLVWNQRGERRQYAATMTRVERLQDAGAVAVIIAMAHLSGEDPLYDEFAENVAHHHPRYARYYEGDEPIEPRRRMRLAARSRSSIPVVTVTTEVANNILEPTGKKLVEFRDAIENNLRPQSRVLPDVSVTLRADFETRVLRTNNVLGLLEGRDPDLHQEVIIVGAHYDHDGIRSGYIWNGADDNGSGTAGVLTLANAFATAPERPKRSIIFALWGAEEKGLLGSSYFVENPVVPLDQIVVKKNLDMIGRDRESPELGIRAEDNRNQVHITVSAHNPLLEKVTLWNNAVVSLDMNLAVRDVVSGGSDHVPFARRGIPIMSLFTGFHTDYHQPSDSADKINYNKMAQILRLSYLNIWTIANYTDDEFRYSFD
jgi:hypothetical protein